ncbi:MAG: SU10 major capsid protein, partial [Alphaproteobacteria bacterium]
IDNSTTTIPISNGASMRAINGKTYIKIGDEVLLVTAGAGTNSLTATRAQHGSSAAAHASGADVLFIQHIHEEGADNTRSDHQTGSKTTNYTQIIRRELKLSGTSQAVNSVGNDNAWANQVKELLPEMLEELFLSAIQSSQSVDGDESLRAMGGLAYYVTNHVDDNGGNDISSELMDDVIEVLLDEGVKGTDLCLLAPTRQISKINALKIARVAGGGMDSKDKTLRQNVDYYEFSDAMVEIVRCPLLAKDEIYVFDKTRFKVCPLKGRSFKVEDIGKVGDSVQKLLIGEYTTEIMNADEAFYRVKNLGV